MGRKAKYEGGAWEIGGLMSRRHQERQAMPLQWRRGDLARLRAHALERVRQGNRKQAKTNEKRGRLSAYAARALRPVMAVLDGLRGTSEGEK